MAYKFKDLNNSLSNIPSGLSGLALGISSLGFTWESAANLHGAGQLFTAIIASCLILPLFLKFIFNPHLLIADLKHPTAGSLTPTIVMATMVIANSISLYYLQLGQVISFLAIAIHICLFCAFGFYQSQNFKLKYISPSWFIPPIGLALALIVYPNSMEQSLAELLFNFALLAFAILLPVILFRLLFSEELVNGEKPVVIILATPASLLLVCYLMTISQPSYLMVAFFIALALVFTLFAYWKLITLLRLPFTPAYSAFTFPLVMGASALFKTSQFLLDEGFNLQIVTITKQFAYFELVVATLMVIYVSLRYLHKFWWSKTLNKILEG